MSDLLSRAVHWNNAYVCVIDVETTGLDPQMNDIWDLCIMPLDSFYRPSKVLLPLDIHIKPRFMENVQQQAIKNHRDKFAEACLTGFEYDKSVDFFHEWFQRLRMPPNKQILPLAHNWPFDRSFLIEWLGLENFNHYFSGHYRDSMALASYLNDVADVMNQNCPFPSLGLKNLCTRLEVETFGSHLASADCYATAECYRKMIGMIKVM